MWSADHLAPETRIKRGDFFSTPIFFSSLFYWKIDLFHHKDHLVPPFNLIFRRCVTMLSSLCILRSVPVTLYYDEVIFGKLKNSVQKIAGFIELVLVIVHVSYRLNTFWVHFPPLFKAIWLAKILNTQSWVLLRGKKYRGKKDFRFSRMNRAGSADHKCFSVRPYRYM